jgi:hypothetical protein
MPDTDDADRALILQWFHDLQERAAEHFARCIVHCGIDVDAAPEIDDAIAAHYRLPGGAYDIERAAKDFATYPPMAASIAALQARKAKTA